MTKPKLKKNADIIRVWYCSECSRYFIDFIADKVYCRACGIEMVKLKYGELK